MDRIDWIRSEGTVADDIDGIETVTPGNSHYQAAQQFVDNKLEIIVTELDVSVPTIVGYPINLQDTETQGDIYHSILFIFHLTAKHCSH